MSSKNATDLTVEELEALLQQKQRRVAEETVSRVVSAEIDLAQTAPLRASANWETIPPGGSPELWYGAEDGKRRFRSHALEPLAQRTGDTGWRDRRRGHWRLTALRSRSNPRGQRGITWRDMLLIALEATAFVGFLAILGTSYGQLRDLNREAKAAQRTALTQITRVTAPPLVPTLSKPQSESPTAEIAMVPIPNVTTMTITTEAEPTVLLVAEMNHPTSTPIQQLPSDLVALALYDVVGLDQSTIAPRALPSQDPQVEGAQDAWMERAQERQDRQIPDRLTIVDLQVDAPVVAGDDWENLKEGVGFHLGGGAPGQPGNVILSAHNDIYGEIFRDLNKLEPGAEVQVHAGNQLFRYQVRDVAIVLPSRVDLLEQTEEATLTLITCYPYLIDTHRVVVRALLVSEDE